MLNENKALIRRYVEECIGKGDMSLMGDLRRRWGRPRTWPEAGPTRKVSVSGPPSR